MYYGYVLKFFSSTIQWVKDLGENPDYRSYSGYEIRIPTKYKIHGIDVSYAQGKIDWQLVREMNDDDVRIHFAFIKATEGLLTVDPYFQRNWREAPKVGIICGAYHFFRPAKDGKLQALFFLQTAHFENGDLPPVVDVEKLDGVSPAKMRRQLKAFIRQIETKVHVKPIIYSGLSFYRDYLKGHFDDYTLWIAHYYNPGLMFSRSVKWTFWQHSDKATVTGINHAVDFNTFKGDNADLKKLLVK